jgi:hypothetical protein
MTTERITSMKTQDLITRIHRERTAMESLWQGLTEKQMTQRPGPQPDWSIKDLIAHLTYWETRMLDNVRQIMEGGADKDNLDPNALDKINAQVFETYKDLPLADVLTAWSEALPKIETTLSAIPGDMLNDSDRFDTGGRSLLMYFIGDTFGHYGDHIDDLRGYTERIKR